MVKPKTEVQQPLLKETTLKERRTFFYGTGRRKTSVARVYLYEGGKGNIVINGRRVEEYFVTVDQFSAFYRPLRVTGNEKTFDIRIKVSGGGLQSQAEACSLGIARALKLAIPETEVTLKQHKLLTRDSRMRERKHYGYRGARRRPQWTKR
ncbi:MAG: 30S ribosomal protein S9 [Planctomycetota bacterium]